MMLLKYLKVINSIGNAYIDYDVSDIEIKDALKSVLN